MDDKKQRLFSILEGVSIHYFQTENGEEHIRLNFNEKQDIGTWSIKGIGPELMEFFYHNRPKVFLESLEQMIKKHPHLHEKIQELL